MKDFPRGRYSAVMRRFLFPALLLLATRLTAADPAEGSWLGETEMEGQRYQVGLEFRAGAEGALTGRQWFPALHLFGSDIGPVTRDGDHVRNANIGLDLVVGADELTGTIAGPHPVRLHRSATLLTTPPAPDYPPGPPPAWTYAAGAALWASPVAAGEHAYIGDEHGTLHAVRLADGQRAWAFATGAAIQGAALVVAESVFALNDSGTVFSLDRTTGALRWKTSIGGGDVPRRLPAATEFSYDFAGAAPVCADGVLYIPSAQGEVLALAADTGEIQWRTAVGGLLRASVCVADDRVVVGSWSGRVTTLRREDGATLWTFSTGGPITSAPVRCGDAVLVGSRDSKLYALALNDGSLRWARFHAGSWIESAPRLEDGVLYLGSSDLRTVTALDPTTGAARWSTDVLGWSWGTPAVTAEYIFAGTAGATGYPIAQDGGLVALDRRTGAPKWRVRLAPLADRYVTGIVGSPTVAGALVLFAGQDGVLYALPAR